MSKETIPMPSAPEVEQAVIGRILESSQIPDDFQNLNENHFYHRSNKLIFKAMTGMVANGMKTDLISVTQKLKDVRLLEEVGGAYYVSKCTLLHPDVPRLPDQYFTVLEEKLRLRNIIEISERAKNLSYENNLSSTIIEELGTNIINFQKNNTSMNLLMDAIKGVEEMIQKRLDGQTIFGLRTNIHPWDKMLGGLNPRFYVVAARAGKGKTALAEQVVDSLLAENEPVLFFQKDMSVELFILRIACRRAGVAFFRFDLGYCSTQELDHIREHVQKLKKAPFYLYSPPNLTPEQFCSIVKIEQKIHDIKAVFLDHILNLDVGTGDYRTGLTRASSMIRASVQETKIAHVILAQLNRGAHNCERPTPANIKEFDALYADCDAMIMLWSNVDPKDVPKGDLLPVKFTCNKNRFGSEFEDDLGFDRAMMTFKLLVDKI